MMKFFTPQSNLIIITFVMLFLVQPVFSQDRVVRDTSNMPTGWVIIDIKKCVSCDATTSQREWTIRRIDQLPVGSIVLACCADKLPDGWLVSNKKMCMCCNIDGENGTQYSIKKVK